MIPTGFEKVSHIFNNKKNIERDDAFRMSVIKVMDTVGGYENFLELPMSAWFHITKGIESIERFQAEKEKAMFGKKKKRGKR